MPTDPNNSYLPIETEYKQDGYHTYLNNGFDKLAKNRRVAGPLADRPNAGQEFAPAWYYAVDDNGGTEYYNAGSEWQRLPTIRYPQGTTGAHIQAAIDDVAAAGSGVVALNPAMTYTTTNELHLKPGVTLQCNDAEIQIDADVNGIFCDVGSCIHDAYLHVTAGTNTSDCIVLDTGRISGGYGGFDSAVKVRGTTIHGEKTQATGLHCIAAGNGIGLGNQFHLALNQCGQAIHMDGQTSWINTSPVYCDIVQCERGILATGDGGNIEYYGTMQSFPDYSKNAVVNDSGGQILFHGIIWDGHRFTGSEPIIQGSDITIITPLSNLYAQSYNSDGSANQILIDHGQNMMSWENLGQQTRFTWNYTSNGNLELLHGGGSGTPLIQFQPSNVHFPNGFTQA
jgi:hypothetical protein